MFHYRVLQEIIKPVDRLSQKSGQENQIALLSGFPRTTVATPFHPALQIVETSFADKEAVCNIVDYGAVSDGLTKNTNAFAKAIDQCAQAGGGTVLVPVGTWLTGAIHLKSNINLHVDKDAVVLFSTDLNDYLPVVFSRFQGVEYYNYSSPIYAQDCDNVAITGEGTIDGQGENTWWDFSGLAVTELYQMGADNVPVGKRVFGTEQAGLRPSFIEFVNCNAVLMQDVKIVNGPMWTIHPLYSQNVIVRGVSIMTGPGQSLDGITIDSTSNVLVENTVLSTGDDAIAIKSGRDADGKRVGRPSENIVIRNNTIDEAHAALAIGSEVSGDVHNVYASNFSVVDAKYGLRIKAAPERRGRVEGIWLENMKMRSTSDAALVIDLLYDNPQVVDAGAASSVKNVHVSHVVSGSSKLPIFIQGVDQTKINDISFDDLDIVSNNGIFIADASDVLIKDMRYASTKKKKPPTATVKDSSRIRFENTSLPRERVTCINCTYDIVKTPE